MALKKLRLLMIYSKMAARVTCAEPEAGVSSEGRREPRNGQSYIARLGNLRGSTLPCDRGHTLGLPVRT